MSMKIEYPKGGIRIYLSDEPQEEEKPRGDKLAEVKPNAPITKLRLGNSGFSLTLWPDPRFGARLSLDKSWRDAQGNWQNRSLGINLSVIKELRSNPLVNDFLKRYLKLRK